MVNGVYLALMPEIAFIKKSTKTTKARMMIVGLAKAFNNFFIANWASPSLEKLIVLLWLSCNILSRLVDFWVLLPWPHRLTVRTPGFHPGNRGSIPRGVTIK